MKIINNIKFTTLLICNYPQIIREIIFDTLIYISRLKYLGTSNSTASSD